MAAGLLAMIAVGCGSSAPPSASQSAAPTPVVTPDPHLQEPVAADDIYRDIGKGVPITPINANLGQGNPDIVKTINANLHGWPLVMGARDAIGVMLDSSLEHLIVESTHIVKRPGSAKPA